MAQVASNAYSSASVSSRSSRTSRSSQTSRSEDGESSTLHDDDDDDGTYDDDDGTYDDGDDEDDGTYDDEGSVHSGSESGTFEGSNSLTSSIQVRSAGETSTFDMSGTNSLTSSIQMRGENSTCSSYNNELSLPSSFEGSDSEHESHLSGSVSGSGSGVTQESAMGGSFSERSESSSRISRASRGGRGGGHGGGGGNNTNGDGTLAVYGSSPGTSKEDDMSHSSANSEDRLALQISKETKPMMHLLRLLKEMELENAEQDNKGKARASLISDFEKEVTLIEHRIKDENLIMNGEQPPLPPNWIALEDPDSGDIYYANEATGETQWERPGLIQELKGRLDDMRNSQAGNNYEDSSHSDMKNSSNLSNNYGGSPMQSNDSNMSNSYAGSVQNNSDQSDNYGGSPMQSNASGMANNYEEGSVHSHSSRSNDYEGDMRNSKMSNNHDRGMENSSTSNNLQGGSQGGNNNGPNSEGSVESSNMSNTYESSLTDSNNGTELAPDWIELEDPDSGEIYYANEVTGESSWDKPTVPQSMPEPLPQLMPEVESESGSDTAEYTAESDDLPPNWIALEDADSGDTYYLNQITMDTTWDKPIKGNDNGTIETPETDPNSEETFENESSTEASTVDDSLPPGWEAILDSSSGDYYYAHESGETQWDRPDFSESDSSQMDNSGSIQSPAPENEDDDSSDFPEDDDNLPPGWFAAVDEDSGDKYYCNEATGETTWDFPTEPALGDESVESSIQDQASADDESDDDLPEGWFAVTDPGSGDTYFVHEESGETTWDRPTAQVGATVTNENNLMSRSSIHDNTVYEDDSIQF